MASLLLCISRYGASTAHLTASCSFSSGNSYALELAEMSLYFNNVPQCLGAPDERHCHEFPGKRWRDHLTKRRRRVAGGNELNWKANASRSVSYDSREFANNGEMQVKQ